MIRAEFILIGCILVVLGIIISSIGYDKIQPTMLENVVSFAEKVSGQVAPDELHQSKTSGYLLLALGGGSVVTGLGFILRSRKK
ncbi:MAG: hypothetical protein HY313_00255 [Acidobacteria bacterium]|nr:hypothetical protein [Acidobacteriota bacterium]